jgi:pullulanase
LIDVAHGSGMRFFCDMVMAFARACPLRNVNFLDFFVQHGTGDPEQGEREGFGGDLFKFNYEVEGYDPLSGQQQKLVPARTFLFLYLEWWMSYYRVDGLRLDSVTNIASEDFLGQFTAHARDHWRQAGGADDRFLVVGEELSVPVGLVGGNRLDGLWNETFKQIARQVLLGRAWEGTPDFAESVHRLIDCRLLGFSDESQAVNYLTSHDIGGPANERLFNWLQFNGVAEAEQRMALAFVCLLTAVGIPMILAGDEFAEQQDLDLAHPERGDRNKQIDPVNFERLGDEWRRRLFTTVSRLVHLRTQANALAVNEVTFIHHDVTEERRVIAWQRGQGQDLVVVVANFSDYATPEDQGQAGEYEIPGWPRTDEPGQWREVCQDRAVAPDKVGREPLRPWTACVYTCSAS